MKMFEICGSKQLVFTTGNTQKVILLVFVLAIFTSCAKNYVCHCKYTDTEKGTGTILFQEETMKILHVKESEASKTCDAYESTTDIGNSVAKNVCELK